MICIYNGFRFTSELKILIKDKLKTNLLITETINAILDQIEFNYSEFNEDSIPNRINNCYYPIQALFDSDLFKEYKKEYSNPYKLYYFSRFIKDKIVLTGALKGYAIKRISKYLDYLKIKDYIINFGGDIMIHMPNDYETLIKNQENGNLINIKGSCLIFNSGNNGKRGNHIVKDPYNSVTHSTVITRDLNLCITADMAATNAVATELYIENKFKILRYYD